MVGRGANAKSSDPATPKNLERALATIRRAHHIIAMSIKKSLENSRTKLVASRFIGLKSKMYSYVKDNEKGGRTAKGIKKNVIKNNIKHEDYENTLINNKQMHHKM